MHCLEAARQKINDNTLFCYHKTTVITKLRIAILGTRGIPNAYGGFEQVAAYLSKGLVEKGHHVTVYNPRSHLYKEAAWNNVNIIHCYDAGSTGSIAQFAYDLACTLDARKRDFDVWLILGYTSSSVWGWLYPKKTVLISNMDGLEWKRSKYSGPVKRFLRFAEKLAVRNSDFLIADSVAIQSYLREKYSTPSEYIAYGAEMYTEENEQVFAEYGVERYGYYLLIARMEPENNVEMILDGFCKSNTDKKFLVVGNTNNSFGKYLVNKFKNRANVIFAGAIYDPVKLYTLKLFCGLYFHGHSCGGTNPSLLEAMAAKALICAHDNPFNKAILGADAYYFSSVDEIKERIAAITYHGGENKMIANNFQKIREQYNWPMVISAYEQFIIRCYNALHK